MTIETAPIPRPADIDAAWLGDMLTGYGHAFDVTDVAVEPVGTGQLGDTVRLTIGYGKRAGPPTMIGKFAASSADSRAIAASWRLYEREVNFYRKLAARARIATARCYGAALSADGSFALLLADCAPARVGDQFAGIAPNTARTVMREAARLHAAFWGQVETPEFAWLDTGPLAQPFYVADVLRGVWPGFKERYADKLTDDMVRVCERLAERYEAYSRLLERPRCVTHNDFRPDNMLFGSDGQVIVVDWQSAALGQNAVDVSYLIGGAFTSEDRRAIEGELLDTYHRELAEQGVRGYSRSDLAQDYRHFSFAGINVAVGAAMMVNRTERGDRLFLTMLDRHVSHVLDTGALAILDER
ncbi:MAG: phosphotransferase [Pseudomonadota bacterium]